MLGLVSVLAPVIATGNTAVVVASRDAPRCPRCPSARCWPPPTCPAASSTSCPAARRRSPPPLAAHKDVNAIDLTGADAELAKELEIAAADNLKRVLRAAPPTTGRPTPALERLTAFLETKTVWHPTGALGASGSSY